MPRHAAEGIARIAAATSRRVAMADPAAAAAPAADPAPANPPDAEAAAAARIDKRLLFSAQAHENAAGEVWDEHYTVRSAAEWKELYDMRPWKWQKKYSIVSIAGGDVLAHASDGEQAVMQALTRSLWSQHTSAFRRDLPHSRPRRSQKSAHFIWLFTTAPMAAVSCSVLGVRFAVQDVPP
eukprot:664894-Pleurochrysis_carterae.AAC.1